MRKRGLVRLWVKAMRKRGLVRLWVVVSIVWAIGSALWLAGQGYETQKMFVDLNCDPFKDDFAECWDRARGPSEGDTWFWAGLRSGNWILIVVPPVLLLIFGPFAVIALGWIVRGFTRFAVIALEWIVRGFTRPGPLTPRQPESEIPALLEGLGDEADRTADEAYEGTRRGPGGHPRS